MACVRSAPTPTASAYTATTDVQVSYGAQLSGVVIRDSTLFGIGPSVTEKEEDDIDVQDTPRRVFGYVGQAEIAARRTANATAYAAMRF